ncbi:DUF1589 domain-containing protein, partial [Rhodopirellula europaea]|uniref:DUF1589 domain-containing protein n=1 Tax=Rhodopirellula europaea TaxID=1263866 RepID=UPI0011819CFF
MAPSRCLGTKRGVQPTFNAESGVALAKNHRQVRPGLRAGTHRHRVSPRPATSHDDLPGN